MSPELVVALDVRPASNGDALLLWEWVNEPTARGSAFRDEPIAWDEHCAWLDARLTSTRSRLYMIEAEGTCVAQVRFELDEHDTAEIDVSVDRSRRGRGIGAEAVTRACTRLFAETGAASVLARVKEANDSSLRMFNKAGFVDDGTEEVEGGTCRRLRLLHPATDHAYVVVAERPWNRRVYEERISRFPGRWTLITESAELTAERLRATDPRYVFFLHWSSIVPATITDAFTCVGFHMTDLPFGRGGSPLQNLVVRGHRSTRLSAFGLEQGLDTGPIYAKADLSLEGSAEDVFIRSSELAADLVRGIVAEEPEPAAQVGEPTVFKRRTPRESEIPARHSLDALYDFVRMLDADGYPRAFLVHEGFRYEFSRATLADGSIRADVTIVPVVPEA
jgi:methionyl-tRNA formyltransferase